MTLHEATEILTKTEFNNLSDWDTYPTTYYCCENCNQTVSIDFKSLTKHQFSDLSNFTSADKEVFRRFEGAA
jgi:hypothetical protein